MVTTDACMKISGNASLLINATVAVIGLGASRGTLRTTVFPPDDLMTNQHSSIGRIIPSGFYISQSRLRMLVGDVGVATAPHKEESQAAATATACANATSHTSKPPSP